MAPKKQHPADIAAEAQMIDAIRAADHFLASLFVGCGRYEKRKAATVLAALAEGKSLQSQYRAGTRGALIYAVGQDGRATMLTRSLIDRLMATPTRRT